MMTDIAYAVAQWVAKYDLDRKDKPVVTIEFATQRDQHEAWGALLHELTPQIMATTTNFSPLKMPEFGGPFEMCGVVFKFTTKEQWAPKFFRGPRLVK